jgi:serine/threonine protein kinase
VSGDTTTDHICSSSGSGRIRNEDDEEEEISSSDPRLHVEGLLLMRRYVMKLGDFGHCCRFDERHEVEEGATRYCAGELIERGGGAVDLYKADIFSLGALVYELCLGGWMGWKGEREGG